MASLGSRRWQMRRTQNAGTWLFDAKQTDVGFFATPGPYYVRRLWYIHLVKDYNPDVEPADTHCGPERLCLGGAALPTGAHGG